MTDHTDLPVLEYSKSCSFWSSVLQCGAWMPIHSLKLLDRSVSGAQFLTGGVFECDIAHCRSVAVLCMLCSIRCNPKHLLNDALPGPHVPVRVTVGALVAHLYTYALPRCRTLRRAGLLLSTHCPSGTTPYSMVWDWRVSKAGPMCFYWPKLLYPYYSFLLFFIFWGVYR